MICFLMCPRRKGRSLLLFTDKSSYLLFNFKADLYAFHSLEELQSYILDLLSDVSEEEGQKSSIIQDLLKYLEWNYQHDITVNELAAHKYFVNPSYLSRLFKAQTGKTFSKYLIELRMKKASEFLKESRLNISDVALFVNPSYLSRLFKAQTGKTFSKYLIELRMKKASEFLKESRLNISDVALCVGYNDVSYFIQTFKKHYGMTPEQYKNQ